MKRKNKNISLNFPNGTRVQTRDEFLDKTDYFSPGIQILKIYIDQLLLYHQIKMMN